VPVTLKDLAELANTSVSTVSRVLSNRPGISEKRRQSILQLARKVGYQPNQLARSLATRKTHTLGFIAASLKNPTYVDLFRRIEGQCRGQGYQVLIADSELDVDLERENVETMLRQRTEGLLILPVADHVSGVDAGHLLDLQLRRVPFVVLGKIAGYNFDCVTSEEVESASRLTRMLLEQGHRRFGIVGVNPSNRCWMERYQGVTVALAQAGIANEGVGETGDRLRMLSPTEEGWIPRFKSWFAEPHPPTAMIATNDMLALRLYRPLSRIGLAIPGDVSIATFGNHFWCELALPSLTTCAPNEEEVARRALETLMKRIENPENPPIVQLVPQDIVSRESCAAPKPSAGVRL